MSVGAAARQLFPPEVEVEAGRPEDVEGDLFPEEEMLVAAAVPRRRVGFRAGRVLARRALARLGVTPAPIGARERRPIWPAGVVGSISHADGCCAVAVARQAGFVGVGIDVEVDGAVTEGIFHHIALPGEREWLAGLDDPRRWATLLFSAKEAFYKALAEIHPEFVAFHDVRLAIDPVSGTFGVEPLADRVRAAVAGREASGRWMVAERWVVTGVVLGATAAVDAAQATPRPR